MLSSKNEAITASIGKASEFQSFILPDANILNSFFTNFLIYRPSLYISGDFYYFYETGDTIHIVIADSVGHGLSAAFISIYAMAMLDKIVFHFVCKEFLELKLIKLSKRSKK